MNAIARGCARVLSIIAIALLIAVVPAVAEETVSNASARLFGANDRAEPQPVGMQHYRQHDARGINVFEAPKEEGVPYNGFKLEWGAAFTQQFQALHHNTSALPRIVSGVDLNKLMPIGSGFNNAMANLYLDAQLARGIRVEMTSYLSSRHHNETWVKDGYLLIDGSPFDTPALDNLMKYLTLRVGHFEINYGDMHFRRTDGGGGMFNPLVGNLIMDAFTTEVGAEAYLRANGFMAMAGATGGEIRGQVSRPADRAPSFLAKVGVDREVCPHSRARLTASLYTTKKSVNNTLYSGSRTGSRYFFVMENTSATEAAQAWSGDLQPGFRSKVTAWVINPFLQYRGLEFFGNIEQAKGRAVTETVDRLMRQSAGEVVYRFNDNRLYLAGRYNSVKGALAGIQGDVRIDRAQAGGGWFITPNIEMKTEYVRQSHRNFPATDIRNGGRFEGMMIEGVVSF